MKERHILTDCDGVLCNWDRAFTAHVEQLGYPRVPGTESEYSISLRHNIDFKTAMQLATDFNQSDKISNLEPFADAQIYVRKLADLGFTFTVVTSVSDHPAAKTYRQHNLTNLFGDVFREVHCLEMNSSKYHALEHWAGSGLFWIEDHMRQAEAGYEQGLRPVLIDHPYNKHYSTDLFPRVNGTNPWQEIYQMVCKEYDISI